MKTLLTLCMVILPFWMYSQISYPNQTISNQSKTPDDYHKHILQINQQNAKQNFTQQLDSISLFSRDSVNSPLVKYKSTYFEYNSDGLVTKWEDQHKYTNAHILVEIREYIYENGLVSKFTLYQATSAKAPLNKELTIDYQYNQQGNITKRIDSIRYPLNGQLIPQLKDIYLYNNYDLIDTIKRYTYDYVSSTYSASEIMVFTYNSQQLPSNNSFFSITNNTSNPLHLFWKTSFEYNSQNQLIEQKDSLNNSPTDSTFIELNYHRYTYNTFGKIDTFERISLEDSSSLFQTISFYDSNNDLDYYDTYYYDADSSSLYKKYTTSYLKNPTIQFNTIAVDESISVFQAIEFYQDPFTYRIDKITSFQYGTQDTMPVSILHYGPFLPNNIAQSHCVQAKVFPNPAQDYIRLENIETGMLEIYSTNGQIVNRVELRGDNKVNVSELKHGIYFYKINNNEGVITGRFVKL